MMEAMTITPIVVVVRSGETLRTPRLIADPYQMAPLS
jgi:hypothetical protein